jgi:hypothetical protein
MKVFATEIDGVLTPPHQHLTAEASAQDWWELDSMADNILEMNRWVLEHHMVPSLVTKRPRETRMVTEGWCSMHNVPYSNFLMGVHEWRMGQACELIDADFCVVSNLVDADSLVVRGVRPYIIRATIDAEDEEAWACDAFRFVDNFYDISRLEEL